MFSLGLLLFLSVVVFFACFLYLRPPWPLKRGDPEQPNDHFEVLKFYFVSSFWCSASVSLLGVKKGSLGCLWGPMGCLVEFLESFPRKRRGPKGTPRGPKGIRRTFRKYPKASYEEPRRTQEDPRRNQEDPESTWLQEAALSVNSYIRFLVVFDGFDPPLG